MQDVTLRRHPTTGILMKFVADVHLHSYFSRATSKNLNLEYLNKWAQLKGVNVVGTGDIAHPGWLAEMREKLQPAEDGLFKLKAEYAKPVQAEVFKACRAPVRFMLAGEISNIYKKNDKVRKIHNVVFMPSFDALEKFQTTLEKIGNIRSDGRPILGLDSRDLLEIVLETDAQGYLIPAHIWTPWFALLGSMSGFDSVEECFDDLTEHIFALETGLSSDPPMNWRLSMLDRYTLVSNSDAHSPQKLAREANVFDTDLSYPAIFAALKSGDPEKFLGTIEFFPEEGKYHYDGHRKCGVRWDPKETLANDCICTVCGKKVTVGVMHRVERLADRELGEKPEKYRPYKSLVPLPEILAQIHGVGVNTKRVNEGFEFLLSRLGSELHILQEAPLEDVEKLGGAMVAEGIRRMRAGDIQIAAGFDGEFGSIHLFEEAERESFSTQLGFFIENVKRNATDAPAETESKVSDTSLSYKRASKPMPEPLPDKPQQSATVAGSNEAIPNDLNSQQKHAVELDAGALLIVAGPGTGKTRTLTHRISHLIIRKNVPAENILAVTFTNKAAEEMQQRLTSLLGEPLVKEIAVATFHSVCVHILSTDGEGIGIPPEFSICSDKDRTILLRKAAPTYHRNRTSEILEEISLAKSNLLSPEQVEADNALANSRELAAVYRNYQERLRENHLLDYDDLVFETVNLFEGSPEILQKYQNKFAAIFVDEYQDINFAQHQFLKLLMGAGSNLCAIGDPDQAIYGFRGANREFFLSFQEDFPDTAVINLSQNYRSTQLIVDASSQVLAKQNGDTGSQLWSDVVSTTRITTYSAPTDKAEAEYIVHEIERMVGGTSYFSIDSGRVSDQGNAAEYSFADFAVLYRTRSQSRLLVEAFARSGMPFQTVGEMSFWETPEIDKLLNYLRFLCSPEAGLYLEKILKQNKRSLGSATIERIVEHSEATRQSIREVMENAETIKISEKQRQTLQLFSAKLEALKANPNSNSIPELIESIAGSFDTDIAPDMLHQLLTQIQPFGKDIRKFLRATVLRSETDEYAPRSDKVALMTLHAAKGLEFPVVFIVGCEENLIPFRREGKQTDIDEERRLLYVGMTRAQQRLIMTSAKTRVVFGKKLRPEPSRFLKDIEAALKEVTKRPFRKNRKEGESSSQMDLF